MAKKNKLPVETSEAINPAPSVKKEYEAKERRYRAEDALRDIQRVECHKKDKQLMKDVKSLAKEQIKALSNVK